MIDPRLADLELISAVAVAEVVGADPSAMLDCAGWPFASDLIAHLGNHFGWVLATIGAAERPSSTETVPTEASLAEWFAAERDRFVRALRWMPESTPSSGEFGMTRTAPPNPPAPYSVPCGPRNTSMRLMSSS